MLKSVGKYKTLLKDIKEELNKWGASAFLSMNMGYHKLFLKLMSKFSVSFKVSRVFKKYHTLIPVYIWESKEPRIDGILMNKEEVEW